jgi:tRNA-dihydrouridine synthase
MTGSGYRNIYARHFGQIDAYYAPFIATSEMKKIGCSLFKDLLPEHNDTSVHLVPQLLGNDGNQFKEFAHAISDMGYNEVNWNIGCPFRVVVKKKKGSGILPHTHMIKRFLDKACSDDNYTITVKMRLGLDNLEDGIDVMKVLNEYPLKGVIIHARTGKQMYTGHVDIIGFGILAGMCKHEVTYNGDILTKNDFYSISLQFPSIKNFMLGRGVLIDPFLPSDIKGKSSLFIDRTSKIQQFHNDIFDYYQKTLYGERHLCDKMKEFWYYMHIHLDKDNKFMKKIKKCKNKNEYLELMKCVFRR